MKWNPQRYLEFGDLRTRPAAELLARVPLADAETVVDLGCGPGNSTRLLKSRFPDARVCGVDCSSEMLDRARQEPDLAGIEWIEADISDWESPLPATLVFTNAALQWVEDHPTLVPRFTEQVAPGGVFAMQIPYRMPGAPYVEALHRVASQPRWRGRFAAVAWGKQELLPQDYYTITAPTCDLIDVWLTEYLHVLSGDDPVLGWTSGTALLPYMAPLDETERLEFREKYAELLRNAYPTQPGGETLFPFARLFLVARKRA